MTARVRRGDGAADATRRQVERLVADLRDGRIEAGLSLAECARAAGLSPSQLGRLERGELGQPTLEQLSRAAAPLGLRVSVRAYPAGSPLRDRAQLALLRRFEACLGTPLRLRREVPIPVEGDARSWDAMVEGDAQPFFVEGESHVRDLQAFERKLRAKLRDDPRSSVVIVVATRSAHHRELFGEHREALRDLLPQDGAAILRALRAGRRPAAGGILLI
jgi:transcriptional regulator with XRE-family HTH domain